MSAIEQEQLLQQAQLAANQKNYAQAAKLFEEYLELSKPARYDSAIAPSRNKAIKGYQTAARFIGIEPDIIEKILENYYLEVRYQNNTFTVDSLIWHADHLVNQGKYAITPQKYREAIGLARINGYALGQALATGGLGYALHFQGRMAESIEHAESCLTQLQAIDNISEKDLLRAWNRIGIIEARNGAYDKAIKAFSKGVATAELLDSNQYIVALNNLGEIHQKVYDLEQALTYHQKAFELAKSNHMERSHADLFRNLGIDHYLLGNFAEGLNYLREGLDFSIQSKDPDLKMQCLYSLALVELEQGMHSTAYAHIQEFQNMAVSSRSRSYQAEALYALGLYQHKTKIPGADQTWQQALFIANETKRRDLLWITYKALADASDNNDLSSIYINQAADIIQELAAPIEDPFLRDKFMTAPQVKEVLDQQSTFFI